MSMGSFTAALIIPTGIGASIGGYGGDAMTLLPLFAAVCDTVITHPNVANAACFQTLPPNVLYVEGYALDRFFEGRWTLQPVRQNRVGVVWDRGIPPEMETLHLNTLQAVQTVYGVDILGVEKTVVPVDLQLHREASGRSAGRIGNPQVLVEAAQTLVDAGAQALAVCCLMPVAEDHEDDVAYKSGAGVDPIAGLEAMISHLLVSAFQIPAAHAPVFAYEDALPVTDRQVDPRAASEFIVSTFLPCVLTGLAKAPQYGTYRGLQPEPGLSLAEVSAVVVPADALGSLPVLSAVAHGIPVLAVTNNQTVMQCPAAALNMQGQVILCATYLEALGHCVSLKAGIRVPPHIQRETVSV